MARKSKKQIDKEKKESEENAAGLCCVIRTENQVVRN